MLCVHTSASFASLCRLPCNFAIWHHRALPPAPLSFRTSSRLPERTRDKIMKFVQQDLFGEQQPGTAFIVKNTGKNEKYKYVAFLSLVRVADAPHPVEFAYTALRGLLLAILEFNQKEGPNIEVVAIPSFALNSSPEHKRYVLASAIPLKPMATFFTAAGQQRVSFGPPHRDQRNRKPKEIFFFSSSPLLNRTSLQRPPRSRSSSLFPSCECILDVCSYCAGN